MATGSVVSDASPATSEPQAEPVPVGRVTYCLTYGLPTDAGGIERPMTPATAMSVST